MRKQVKDLEEKYKRKDIPGFGIGDNIDVHFRIKEENKIRVQVFSGVVIGRNRSGLRETFTVRRISYGEGVERTFPLHSPRIDKIDVRKKGKVRRAKLYYLRGRKGKKATKVREKIGHKREAETE
jgi:large subunit ribosomal protein L19